MRSAHATASLLASQEIGQRPRSLQFVELLSSYRLGLCLWNLERAARTWTSIRIMSVGRLNLRDYFVREIIRWRLTLVHSFEQFSHVFLRAFYWTIRLLNSFSCSRASSFLTSPECLPRVDVIATESETERWKILPVYIFARLWER